MRLDFSILSGGQGGQRGHTALLRVSGVPQPSPAASEQGDNPTGRVTSSANCPPVSPKFPTTQNASDPGTDAAVPPVPPVPIDNEQVCIASEPAGLDVVRQIRRWIGVRCTRTQCAWAAEKFLYLDYLGWCQQAGQQAIPRKRFVSILTDSYARESDGWRGLCLALDFAARGRIATDSVQ